MWASLNTSRAELMVLAVYIPPQAPAPGQACRTTSNLSSSLIFPTVYAPVYDGLSRLLQSPYGKTDHMTQKHLKYSQSLPFYTPLTGNLRNTAEPHLLIRVASHLPICLVPA